VVLHHFLILSACLVVAAAVALVASWTYLVAVSQHLQPQRHLLPHQLLHQRHPPR
jgi:hypothetical protein